MEKIPIEKYILPQCVFCTIDPKKETANLLIERQEKFLRLPEEIKDKLATTETGNKIHLIGKAFGLELLQIASIARAVRNYYFNELLLEKFPETFVREMGIDPETARKISEQVVAQIINDDSFEKAYAEKIESLPIREAIQKYPEAGEELITSERISLKGFPEEVRPSIKNWISDYTFNLGYGEHDSIQRGRYLFQNQNARNLSEEERERLSFILRAFDENISIEIDKDTRKISIPKPKMHLEMPPKVTRNIPSEEENIQSTQFDFHQKMPFESKHEILKTPVKEARQEIAPSVPRPSANPVPEEKPISQRPLAPQRITPRSFQMRSLPPKIPTDTDERNESQAGTSDSFHIQRSADLRPRVNLVSGITEEKRPISPKNVVDLKNL